MKKCAWPRGELACHHGYSVFKWWLKVWPVCICWSRNVGPAGSRGSLSRVRAMSPLPTYLNPAEETCEVHLSCHRYLLDRDKATLLPCLFLQRRPLSNIPPFPFLLFCFVYFFPSEHVSQIQLPVSRSYQAYCERLL